MKLGRRTMVSFATDGLQHRHKGYTSLGSEDQETGAAVVLPKDGGARRANRAGVVRSRGSTDNHATLGRAGTQRSATVAQNKHLDAAALALLNPAPPVSYGAGSAVFGSCELSSEEWEDGEEGWRKSEQGRGAVRPCLPLSSIVITPAKRLFDTIADRLKKCVECVKDGQGTMTLRRWRETLTRRRRGWHKAHCD